MIKIFFMSVLFGILSFPARYRRELPGDVAHPHGVGRPHLGRLVPEPQQQLLVEGELALAVLGPAIPVHGREAYAPGWAKKCPMPPGGRRGL